MESFTPPQKGSYNKMTDLHEAPENVEALSLDEKMLLAAVRDGNPDHSAYMLVRLFLKQGKTPAEILQAAIAADDYTVLCAVTKAVNKHLNPPEEVWTYEKEAAFYILGVLATESALAPGVIDSPHSNGLSDLIGTVGNALIDALHRLGSEGTLEQILDRAADGGAE